MFNIGNISLYFVSVSVPIMGTVPNISTTCFETQCIPYGKKCTCSEVGALGVPNISWRHVAKYVSKPFRYKIQSLLLNFDGNCLELISMF